MMLYGTFVVPSGTESDMEFLREKEDVERSSDEWKRRGPSERDHKDEDGGYGLTSPYERYE